mmetsp:Transcript_4077/g.6993  ORF Transcript_4077/g.6993 Transcript_4077/m.6993 type:complete len:807 (-) Transcript_4077:28-2448(-)
MADESPKYVAATCRMYLSSSIRNSLDIFSGGDTSKERIIGSITSVSHYAAKCRNRGSQVMAACALDCYNKRERAFPAITDGHGKATPFVSHAFNINLPLWKNKPYATEISEEVVSLMNQCYPIALVCNDEGESKFSGYSRFNKSLTNTYATCAGNHARMNFFIYQNKTILDFLRSRGHKFPKRSCKELIKIIKCRINNLDVEEDDANDDMLDELVPDENRDENGGLHGDDVEHFINFHRSFFSLRNIDAPIDDDWVEDDDNTGVIILYFVHLLTYQERLQRSHPTLKVRLFHPLPMHKMKPCHIEIEPFSLFYILKKAGLMPGTTYWRQRPGRQPERIPFPINERGCTDPMKRWWPIIFRTEIGRTSNRDHYTSQGIRTNGVMASLIYVKTLNPATTSDILLDMEEVEDFQNVERGRPFSHDKGDQEDSSDASASHAAAESEGDDSSAVPENAEEDPPAPPQDDPEEPEQAFAGVDPGLVDLWYLVFAIINTDKDSKNAEDRFFSIENVKGTFEYSSAAHRHNCKTNSFLVPHIRKLQAKNRMFGMYTMFSRTHFKTASLRTLSQAIRLRTRDEVWHRCWEQAFNKSILRAHGYCDGMKRKSLQDQMNIIKSNLKSDQCFENGAELQSVGFGNGSFGSSMPGMEGGVPTKAVKVTMARNFNTQHVDEWRSSSSCPCCHRQLKNLFHWYDGKRHYVRGIKFCASEQCKSHRFWHRDWVGAYNILVRHLVDLEVLDGDQIPFFLQRATTRHARWRPNKSERNLLELKTSRRVALPRKKMKRIIKEKRKTKKEKKRNRVKRRNDEGGMK